MAQLTGEAQIMGGDIRLDESTQSMALGAKAVTPDGRAFRYVKCGSTAVVAGKLYDGPATVDNHASLAVPAAVAAGSLTIGVTLGATAATANQYAGGYAVISNEAGEGFTYSIKSHPAADASAALTVTLDDDEPVVTALTTSSVVTLVLNQYNGVIIHASTETGIPVGGGNTQITAAQYGWLQTRGPIAMLHDATNGAAGDGLSASLTTDGAVTKLAVVIAPVGYLIDDGVSTEYNPAFLTID